MEVEVQEGAKEAAVVVAREAAAKVEAVVGKAEGQDMVAAKEEAAKEAAAKEAAAKEALVAPAARSVPRTTAALAEVRCRAPCEEEVRR